MRDLDWKWLPHPLMTLIIFAMWLLLWDGYSAGLAVTGALVAVGTPVFARRFWPDAPRIKNLRVLVDYCLLFGWDIMIANLHVAWLIAGPNEKLRPTFLEVPLDIEHPFLIMILANTISLTPGTVSANVAGDHKTLLVHALDCEDPDAEVERIKERYEERLAEIFR